MNPVVSIIIPLHNAEDYIHDTLLSIQEQSLENFECIIVNDLSSDNSLSIIKDNFSKDKRFKVVSLRANSGACTARNVGIRMARGRYICFLDADDLFVRESLELRVKTLEGNDDPLLIGTYCGSYTIEEKDKLAPNVSEFKSSRIIDFVTSSGACPFNANQPMFKTDILKKTGGFDEQLSQQAEDYEFWIRILRLGYYFLITPHRLVCYRNRLGSTVRRKPLNHLEISYRWQSEVYKDYSMTDKVFLFNKDISYYKLQLDVSNRVFEFVGMGLASDVEESELLDILIKKLPSYNFFLYRHRDAFELLMRGVKRQLVNLVDKKFYEQKVSNLIGKFKSNLGSEFKKPLSGCNEMWFYRSQGVSYKPDIVFLPHKDYHVWTISLIVDALRAAGLSYVIVDLSCHYRDERTRSKAAELGLNLIGYSNWVLSRNSASLIVGFNDWDPIVRSILKCAQVSGIKTATIVEGIQDYYDADTRQTRHAYRSSDIVFLPGIFDKKYFSDTEQKLSVLGVPRVKELYLKYNDRNSEVVCRDKRKVLINSNFSYGVLEDKRDKWLSDVVSVCVENGFQPVISRHPADKGTLFAEFVSQNSFYEELDHCHIYISRFASGILEALAADLEVIYYNPSLEKVDKFMYPEGAYVICENKLDLSLLMKSPGGVKTKKDESMVLRFLHSHCGDPFKDESDILVNAAKAETASYDNWVCFQSLHQKLDLRTGCFNNIKVLRDNLSATYSNGKASLDDVNEFLQVATVLDGLIKTTKVSDDGDSCNEYNIKNSLADANELMRRGFYLEAKSIFLKLFNSSEFYYFLRANIELCEKRLKDSKLGR